MRLVCTLAVAFPFLVGCATAPPKPIAGPPLDSVLKEVQRGLQKAQDALAASSLPQLKSVQLALHTQVQKDATGKITILVISVGGGEGASASQDLALTLTPPKPDRVKPLTRAQATVADSIVELIEEAAQAAENARKGPFPLEAEKLTLELAFTVTSSLDGGLKFSLGSVSADVGGAVKNAAQQKITITFSTTHA
jgi:hypothetical protein